MNKQNLIHVVDAGHKYKLKNVFSEETQTITQTIQFTKKTFDEKTGEQNSQIDGTTDEAVLQMMINRMQVLNEKFPSEENATCIKHLEAALAALYARTEDREKRGVEGTHQA